MTVLYGSAVADTTLTTACLMATASGGVETSKVSNYTGTGNFGEVWSKGTAGVAAVSSIPAPTGHGWVYYPGAGTFAAGNWALVLTYAAFANNQGNQTFRAYKLSGGVYTAIGTILFTATATAKTTYSPTAVSMPAVTTGASDGIYFDLWYQDNTGAGGESATIYESTSSTAGVASDLQVTTSTFTAGGITNNTMASTDALVVSDLGPALQSWPAEALTITESILYTATALPVDGLSAADRLLATDTALPSDAASVSDLGGSLQRWPIDTIPATDSLLATDTAQASESLAATDSFLQTDTALEVESLIVSDVGGSLQRWPVDGLSASDRLLAQETVLSTEALSAGDSFLATDSYLPVEQIPVADTFSTGAGVTNNTMASTDQLSVSDSFLAMDTALIVEVLVVTDAWLSTDTYQPREALAVVDSLTGTGMYVPMDALAVTDMGSVQRWGIAALVASDSFLALSIYGALDGLSAADRLLVTDGVFWTEALQAGDVSSMVSAAAAALLYLSATCTTRDMQATAKTRDMQARATTRDSEVIGRARDMQVTASARDERATAKTRG
jgi:hypothetical protein